MAGNVELNLTNSGWGGDLTIDATGDIVLVSDQPNNPAASLQRIYRNLMTNARIFDDNGNPASSPNDLFAPGFGGSLRALTGQMMTPTLVGEIESNILNGLQQDPTIATSPSPTVTVQNAGSNVVQISLSCESITGETITLPSFPLSLTGGT